MNIQAYFPQGLLKEFIDSILFLSGTDSGTGVAFPRMHQVIIINLGTPFNVSDVYLPKPKDYGVTNNSVWINGLQEAPFMLENRGVTAMYAIGLKSGMAPWFADLPASETNNQAVSAENWTSREIFHLREQLLATPDISSGFILIERYLTALLRKKDFSNLDKIQWLGRAIHTHRVEEICRCLGVTRKKLRSEALLYFGNPIKNLQGMIRLNQVLSSIACHPDKSLSSLHDYYDQSHFINDFKAWTGIAPLLYKRLCVSYPVIKQTPNFISLPRETFLQFLSQGSH